MDEQMFYCPFCQRDLVGIRDDEFSGYVFVNDFLNVATKDWGF